MSGAHPFVSLPVAVRAYASSESRKDRHPYRSTSEPSEWSLVFDTETETGAAQQLRFGTYQVRRASVLIEEGVFFDEQIPPHDLATLQACLKGHPNRQLRPLPDFIENVLFYYAYDLRALCIGFNLPFDISRIALEHDSARRAMKGGFTFKLSDKRSRPRIQVKHLSSRASLIRFGLPWKQLTPRGMRKRGLSVPPHRGFFLDVKTLAGGVLSGSFSLRNLAEHLGTEHKKLDTDYEGPITQRFVEYALNDVQVTWECFEKLRERYLDYGLTETPVHRIYSEASLGKAYLKQMGIRPWRDVQPEFPLDLLGAILSTYYGGRSEVRIRRKAVRVVYCDFMSMYPTVCTLMGLWRFVGARGMTHRDSTEETRAFLARTDLPDLQNPETWRHLCTIVQVQPEDDILPVRARYGEALPGHDPEMPPQHSIGLNYLSADGGHWVTLADCIESKLLTGRPPKVLRAFTFQPGPHQKGLKPIRIAGKEDFEVDPSRQDFYKRLIELRVQTKGRKDADGAQIEAEAHALKICANATSYGIFVELNVSELDDPRKVKVFGPEEPFEASVKNVESEGHYFHPLLATLITGAARLMLAIAEKLATDEGLSWVFCDTDSMALAQPEGMPGATFLAKAERVRRWFSALSPYAGKPDLFKLEDQNFGRDKDRQLAPLYCWAVSAKRYALFNLDAEGHVILRKASAHGLGHLIAPYEEKDAPASIPAPRVPLRDLGVERWQHDLWIRIIEAGLAGNDRVDLEGLQDFDRPAASRYAATTPAALRWFKHFNEKHAHYREQVRPFGFLYSAPARKLRQNGKLMRGSGGRLIRAVSPFGKGKKGAQWFDRETGNPVSPEDLATYASSLNKYHIHPEDKFENADYDDIGTTTRRHIRVAGIEHIGKESNRWEDDWHLGSDADSNVLYGSSPENRGRARAVLQNQIRKLGVRRVARRTGLSPAEISGVVSGRTNPSHRAAATISVAITSLQKEAEEKAEKEAYLRARIARAQQSGPSIAEISELVGIDPSNLRKVLCGRRIITAKMLNRLLAAVAEAGNGPASGGY